MPKLLRAIPDLIWSFFPVFFLVLVLSLFGKADQLASRSDLILGASVLFAEGWWKVRAVRTIWFTKGFYEMLGFLGAATAVVLTTVMLLNEIGSISELAKVTTSGRFANFQLTVEVISVLYALQVRAILLNEQDVFEKIRDDERQRLNEFEKQFPEVARELDLAWYRAKVPTLTEEEYEEIKKR